MNEKKRMLAKYKKVVATRRIIGPVQEHLAELAGRHDDPVSVHVLATLQNVADAIMECAESDGIMSLDIVIYRQAELEDIPPLFPPRTSSREDSSIDDLPF